MTPPEVRGAQVHVIQDVGSRRADAVPTDGAEWAQNAPAWPQQPQEAVPPEQPYEGNGAIQLDGNIYVSADGGTVPRAAGSGWRGTPQPLGRATASSGGWQGRPPSGGSVNGTWHGTPPSSGGGGWRGTPSGGGSGSGGGGLNLSGGGGNGGEAMVVLAVVLAAIAVVMAVGLVSS